MAARRRDDQVLATIRRALDPHERLVGHTWCWVARPHPHVPLLLLRRRPHDAFVTEHRLVLVARHRRPLRPSDVILAARLEALTLLEQHHRTTLVQQHIGTDAGSVLVLEWRRRDHDLARVLARGLGRRRPRVG